MAELEPWEPETRAAVAWQHDPQATGPRVGECSGMSLERCDGSAHVLDDLDQLINAITLAAGEVDELARSLDDGPAFGCPCN